MTYELKIRCSFCDRFLKLKAKESSHIVVTCPDRKCRKDNDVKIVMMSSLEGKP